MPLKKSGNTSAKKTSKPAELSVIAFDTPKKWDSWLKKYHLSAPGVWVRIFKKGTDIKSIDRTGAIEVALCYGWIDGQANKFDDDSYIQKFTPRRKGSIWSRINVGIVERLQKEGRMKPEGLRQIQLAKENGQWAKAYDSPKNMKMPDDFLAVLEKNKKAKKFFETLNKTNTFAIAFRLQTAKKPETRERRMKAIIQMLAKGEKFH